MKKKLVVCALVLCVLATLLAVPAMAEDKCTHPHQELVEQKVVQLPTDYCKSFEWLNNVYRCQDCNEIIIDQDNPFAGKRGEHKEGSVKVIERKEPTCTDWGYTKYLCEYCGDEWMKQDDKADKPLGHIPQTGITLKPCQEGKVLVDCARCKEQFMYENKNPVPHTPGQEWITTKEDTCTTVGEQVKKCTVCGEVCEKQDVDKIHHEYEKLGHQDPTCQKDGYDTETCKNCGDTKVTTLVKVEHKYETDKKKFVTKLPNCGDDGYVRAYCVYGCGDYDTVQILSATGAHEIEWIVEEATCTKEGKRTPHCVICDFYGKTETIEVIPHAYNETVEKATCQHPGYKHYVCAVCGYKADVQVEDQLPHNLASEVHPATCAADGWTDFWCTNEGCDFKTTGDVVKATGNHKFTVDFEPKPATCTEGGWTRGVKCEVCGKWGWGEKVAPLGHAEVKVEAVAATCDAAGSNAGVKCSRCGAIVSGCEAVAATGHEKVTDAAAVAATCDKAGSTEAWHCKNCNYAVKAEAIPALGHKEATVAGKAATCTEKGLTDGKKCSVCGAVTVAQKEIPALGHKEATVAGKAATCTEKGLTDGKKCSVCGTVTVAQKEIAALGHKAGAEVVTKAATCTEKGTATISCTVCKTVLETKEIAALGHKAGELVVVKDSTCRKTGTGTISCTVCGVKLEDKEIARKEHRYDKQSTCLVCGYNPFGGSTKSSKTVEAPEAIVVNAEGKDAKYTSAAKDGVQTVTVTETVADGTYYILKISKDTLDEFKKAGASTVDFVVGKAVLSIPMAALESVDLSSGELQFSVPVGEGQFSAQLLKNDVSADQTDAMTAAGVVVK